MQHLSSLTRRTTTAASRTALLIAAITVHLGLAPIALSQNTTLSQNPSEPPAALARNLLDKNIDVPVTKVMLYSSGVGYFQHAGSVRGDSSTQLTFKTDQINDILKSLVLQDLDGGKVGTVSYPSQDPLSKKLGSFAIDLSGSPTQQSLLQQLRGAAITIELTDRNITGTVVSTEMQKQPAGQVVVDRPVVTLLTTAGLQTIKLDEIRSFSLQDKMLQAELSAALAALADAKRDQTKTVEINFTGSGERRVALGYVVQTPIWKTSYRLVMGEKPSLQGWAIVENQTDNDWENIQLSLVSGRPISFTQNLYQPVYATRPVVEIERFANLRPREYEGGGELQNFVGRGTVSDISLEAAKARREMPALAQAAPASVMPGSDATFGLREQSLNAAASISAAATGTRIGELFQYTIPSASIARQSSAMLPIVSEAIDLTPLTIYNAAVLSQHPLNGARLTNSTTSHLLGGPVTVIDAGAYGGDALLDDVPPGQSRLLSYGVDLETVVNVVPVATDSTIQTAKIVRGVLETRRKTVSEVRYDITSKSTKDKTLILEHPVNPGWEITSAKPIESTDRFHRFEMKLPAGKPLAYTVKQESVTLEGYALLDTDLSFFEILSRGAELPADVKAALQKAAELRRGITTAESEAQRLQAAINEISQEQSRLRENMRTVDRNTDYYQRLLKKLNDQETEVEKLRLDIEKNQQTAKSLRSQLDQFLANLNVG